MVNQPERTYYSVLGLGRDATAKQIKDAYRRAARTAHPDHGGNPELFHDVAVAYETLSDAGRRAGYDRSLGNSEPSRTARPEAAGTPSPPRPPGGEQQTRPALYVPPYKQGTTAPLPLTLAGQQLHGLARRPGFLDRLRSNAAARYDGERLTAQLLEKSILPGFPALRLVNGLVFGNDLEAGHALLAGYRIAVVDSLVAPPGNFHWDGRNLRHRGRTVGNIRINETVRQVQDLFPECNVRGWLVLHGRRENPFEPIVDYPPSLDRSGLSSVHVANPGTLLRETKRFLSEGPQPSSVQVPVLARLLNASER
ncbi:J domain-containing protein [Arthrobacter sp. H5]|uniref:J domain-containing protein n=1 Tax=Arthrobacter sp. H5 TaxID=1267973 RepID=UPI000484DAFA|nr:J domain-containing protein [Arthrobacter sp. H5]